MKMPKDVKRYCPYCKKTTEQKIVQNKSGKKRGALTIGQRRFESKTVGYGGFPRPKPEKGKRFGSKTSKKLDLRYQCKVCKKLKNKKSGFRIKKLEWEAGK